jgi:serine/threonine protein kinase
LDGSLKGPSLQTVKIADFGLSAFYRPGATMKSSCGTLSFLAPEVFNGTSNAGPPLDVWSLGVILFALLCGRLPFEGSDLNGTKRPREAIIRSRIIKCQYKIDENLGPEAKDLVRRMLKLDPAERASIPEVLNHIWMRQNNPSVSHFDSLPPQFFGAASTNTPTSSTVKTGADKSSVRISRQVSTSPSDVEAVGGGHFANLVTPTPTPDINDNESDGMMSYSPAKPTKLSRPSSSSDLLGSHDNVFQNYKPSASRNRNAVSVDFTNGEVKEKSSGKLAVSPYNGSSVEAVIFGVSGGRPRRGSASSNSLATAAGASLPGVPPTMTQLAGSPSQSSFSDSNRLPGPTRHLSIPNEDALGSLLSGENILTASVAKVANGWVANDGNREDGTRSVTTPSRKDRDRSFSDAEKPVGASTTTFRLEPLRRPAIVVDDDEEDDNDYSSMAYSHLLHSPAPITPSMIGGPSQDFVGGLSINNNPGSKKWSSRSPVNNEPSVFSTPNALSNNGTSTSGATAGSRSGRPKTVNSEGRSRRDKETVSGSKEKWLESPDAPDEYSAPLSSPYSNSSAGSAAARRGGRRGSVRPTIICCLRNCSVCRYRSARSAQYVGIQYKGFAHTVERVQL